jgi:tetratricopeptide (TPR) repeat protein
MRYPLALFFLTFTNSAWTQQAPSKKASTELKEVSVELESAIKSSEKNTLAKLLVKSAELYKEQGNFAKSEEYYKKAIEEYQKLNNQTEVARLTRELALIQESQDKKSEAIFNYKKSKVASKSENVKTKIEVLNDNDIKRLEGTKSENSKSDEKELIQSNIEINKQIPTTLKYSKDT